MVVGSTDDHMSLEAKIILLGDYSVGKSSLLRVLARHSSQISDAREDNSMSISSSRSPSSFRKTALTVRSNMQPGGYVEVEFTHQDRSIRARIADTGGQERYRSMTTSYYRGAHGCLLMFDVTKEDTFRNLDTWVENIAYYKTSEDFPCILVGTRCKSPARRISYEQAAQYANARGLPYMELDMAHMTDVRRVFESLLDSVTVNMSKRAPIAISIHPELSSKDVCFRKNVVCSC